MGPESTPITPDRIGSDQAVVPAEMLRVEFPSGTNALNPTEQYGVGAVALLHGRIQTYDLADLVTPDDYWVAGSLLVVKPWSMPNTVQVYIARRGLTGQEINEATRISKGVIDTHFQIARMRKILVSVQKSESDIRYLDPFNENSLTIPQAEQSLQIAGTSIDDQLKALEQARKKLIREADKLGIVFVSGVSEAIPIRSTARNLVDDPVQQEAELESILKQLIETQAATHTSSRNPLVEALKSRFTMANLKEKLFGGNALPGHGITFITGMLPSLIDYHLNLTSEPTVLTLAPVAVLVASLLLPYHGYDRFREYWQANIVTYGPMFTLGTTGGGLVATRLLESSGIDSKVSLLTSANGAGLLGAGVVLMAYITVGFMSRRERWEILSRLNVPESVLRIDTTMMMRREHMIADRLHRAIGTNNIEDAIAQLEEMKEVAYEEEEMDLDRIRTSLKVDRFNDVLDYRKQKLGFRETLALLGKIGGRLDRLDVAKEEEKKKRALMKTLDMLHAVQEEEGISTSQIIQKIVLGKGSIDRTSGFPLWLIEQAEEDLVAWHNNPQTPQLIAANRKRRRFFGI